MVGTTRLGRLLLLRDVTDERAVERLREDMTGTMVHDLRNPLSSIFSALTFLKEDAANSSPPTSARYWRLAWIAHRECWGWSTAFWM